MCTRGTLHLLSLALLTVVASTSTGIARNFFPDFTKAPTFAPPENCIPNERTYGVISRCARTIEPGHSFTVYIDTVVGFFRTDARSIEIFVSDHVAEIKTAWERLYPRNDLAFSSRDSSVTPANAPAQWTRCKEYSISVETEKAISGQRVPVVQRTEGLTCAWSVEGAAAGKHNIELFWLEASDEHTPSLGQTPLDSFNAVVRELFASARL